MASNLIPIISQKDLESISLMKTGFGFALKAFHAPENTDVSLKLLTSQNTTERELKALLQEVASTRCMQCERLLPALGICQFQGFLGVVTEWIHNGSLDLLIHEHELCPELPFPLSMRILSDVSEGLNYLHSLEPPILHYSLKPSNVLIDLEYRAKISDYGFATWRRRQIPSLLQSCNDKSGWDLLYFAPEILQGGSFSPEGDMYSFGMMCWENLSRQKPLRGKKTLLEAVTAVCSGVRPEIESAFVANDLPHRNKLVQLIALCWHHEPLNRPCAAECATLLQTILSTFRKETVSDAIYNLIHAKDCAINAAKGPVTHVLVKDPQNLEIICTENNNRHNKEINLKAQILSNVGPQIGTRGPVNEDQTLLARSHPYHGTTVRRGHPVCNSKGSRSPPHSLSTFLMPDSSASDRSTFPFCEESEDRQKPLPKPAQDPGCSLTYNSQQNSWSENRSTGSCYKQKSCSILACERVTILNCMTEGRLNHILDVLRSQQLLSRADYETITSFPTLTARTRAMLDTCLSLGEKAAQTAVSVLSTSKCSPLLRSIQENYAVN
ncbi:receptor-interacting serine/threonine-protein kinase 2-like [Sceloporus undulatus]|uniref:receptor-interacting serine/threonine-protein kinase 2-like n=1 Tax=Sceloporus undulatus TaxID=8520 RepID=UPI001C4AE14C|nr:receptor-interacting serine/threonine-protein kinase 2-like [Sceloporus undulatus]